MTSSAPPAHARPFHTITTPRLLIRSCIVSDALGVNTLRSEPLNNPFGGVVDPDLPVSVQEERIEAQKISTAEGKNAWMVIILKDPRATDPSVEALRVEEGTMIGNTGFNCFPLQPSLADPSKEVIMADTGVLVDYRFAKKGYALEAQCAVIEYGFEELGCGMISLETNAANEPFRNLMRTMGISEKEIRGEGEKQEVAYLFDREMWEGAKKQMNVNRKWYL